MIFLFSWFQLFPPFLLSKEPHFTSPIKWTVHNTVPVLFLFLPPSDRGNIFPTYPALADHTVPFLCGFTAPCQLQKPHLNSKIQLTYHQLFKLTLHHPQIYSFFFFWNARVLLIVLIIFITFLPWYRSWNIYFFFFFNVTGMHRAAYTVNLRCAEIIDM